MPVKSVGKISLVLVAGLLCSIARGVPELSYELTELISAGDSPALTQAIQAAIRHVRALPPTKNNPLRARISRRVHIVLTTSRDPVAQEVFAVSARSAASDDGDAFTFTVGNPSEPSVLTTYIFLLVDRLCRDPATARQRPDAFVRIVAALGHEIYGNLPIQFKLVPGQPPPAATFAERRSEEMSAFRAGISFLTRYLASDLWDGFPEATKGYIEQALERDRRSLETWRAGSECAAEVIERPKRRSRS